MRPLTQRSTLTLALHSYARDVRGWITGRVTSYLVAYGLIAAGAISLLVAIGFGIGAVFYLIETHYGVRTAFAATGGFFLALGLIGLVAGRVMLSRSAPPVPRPRRQMEMVKRAIAAPVATRLILGSSASGAGRADPVTQSLAAAAAVLLVGWIVAGRFKRRPQDED